MTSDARLASASSRTARHVWEQALAPLLGQTEGALWRAHCDALNAELLDAWLGSARYHRLLKTDLYDEAVGEGLYALLAGRARHVVGIDVARNAAAAASSRHRKLQAVHADVRRLPFADTSFDAVVSNSTLDHFDQVRDIEVALANLHRVLVRGGTLLLTLDNLANPAVALRNALPLQWLRRLGIVPYPVGATYRPRQLNRALERAGFEIVRTGALLHCPRALAVAKARRLQRRGGANSQRRFLRRLMHWERLGSLPTRYVTGYFLAVLARKA